MKQNTRESLSALMDDEGDDLELRRVLKSLEAEPQAADTWRRYHLARSAMRRERDTVPDIDLSAGILARLEGEPAPGRAVERSPRRFASWAGRAAVAAGVSLAVITGVQFYNQGDAAPEMAGRDAATEAPLAAADASPTRPSLVDLPLFQRGTQGTASPLMTVGAESPWQTANSRQSQRNDQQQALLLQSYLDRHAQGSAYRSGDAWMPLLRASASELQGQR